MAFSVAVDILCATFYTLAYSFEEWKLGIKMPDIGIEVKEQSNTVNVTEREQIYDKQD